MNHKDKINEIIEVSKKRLELKKIGLLPYAIGQLVLLGLVVEG